MPNLAANLSMMFTEVPFLDRFAAAAGAGFGAVEYLFPYEWPADTLAERLAAEGLQQVLFNLPPGDWEKGERGLAALPGREDDFRQALEQALTYAKTLDCPQVHAMAGLAATDGARTAMADTYVSNLKWAADRCARDGIGLLIEPINPFDIPGYFLNHSYQARRIIAAVGHPNLKLQCDLYHMQRLEGHLAETLDACWDVIGHIQIAGVPGRHEPDRGEINYPYLFDRIDAKGYQGWIGCEYRPEGDTVAGLGWARRYGLRA